MPVLELATNAAIRSPIDPSAARSKAAAMQVRDVVREQGRALEQSCEKSAIQDTLLAARWHRWNLWLGVSSAVIAAFAAFSAGEGGKELLEVLPHGATVFALISAVLTSTLTFLAPSEKAGAYHHFSNKLRALRDRARTFVEIDCTHVGRDAALRDKFERLMREKSEIESSHPIVPCWAYEKSYVAMKKKVQHKQSLQKVRELEAQDAGRGERRPSLPTAHAWSHAPEKTGSGPVPIQIVGARLQEA
jgi:hypothetical protein